MPSNTLTTPLNSVKADEKPAGDAASVDLESQLDENEANAGHADRTSCCTALTNWFTNCWEVTRELSWKENIFQFFCSALAAISTADASIDITNRVVSLSTAAAATIGAGTGVTTFFATASGVGNSLKNSGQLAKTVKELAKENKQLTSKMATLLQDVDDSKDFAELQARRKGYVIVAPASPRAKP